MPSYSVLDASFHHGRELSAFEAQLTNTEIARSDVVTRVRIRDLMMDYRFI
ncbi:hypothetical protein MTR_8g463150 [Medicago truncatula]|uniref:Uncharacterized protein n=1 Tax=Medicago truncatula TaxID=3880 RepID=A0A072TPT9_MEDTR|nr:hypothetical protein MTR_8g463150 [Medicago truncatula]